jgi:hypothetical protein
VGDRVESLARDGIGKHHAAQPFPIESSGRVDDRRAERLDDVAQAAATGGHDFARELVRVDDGYAAAAQPMPDGAFARSDAARQTEEMHGYPMAYTFDLGAMRETTESRPEAPKKRPKMPRRAFIGAVVGTALVIGGSAIALTRRGGYALPAGRKLAVLAPWQFVVVEHAARRIAAPDREADPFIPTADELDVASFVDDWLTRLPARVRRDLGRFLAYVEHVAPMGIGSMARFTRLSEEDQDRVLASVESSSSDLLRAGFDGLRSLVFLGYYRDPRTWRIIGYDGPLVGRPQAGW